MAAIRWRVLDVVLTAVLFVAGVQAWVRDRPVHSAAVVGLAAWMSLPLLWRRRYPATVFAVVAAGGATQVLLWVRPQPLDLTLLIATYSVAAYGSRVRALAALGVDAVGAVTAALIWASPRHTLLGLVAALAAMSAIWVVGDNVRTRRAYLSGLEERAERLEAERDINAALAAAAERARIAREMHDVVAHSLSVIISQADGATFALDRSPEQARAAMATVASTGRSALAEMRRLLGVLRDDVPGELAPQPGIDRLTDLAAHIRAAGLTVTLDEQGDPAGISDGMSLTVFRVVQEALTNALKHAGAGTRVGVRLRYGAAGVDVDVTDDGSGVGRQVPHPAGEHGGHGLVGMRERAALYGGRVVAGPATDGGWRVHVRLNEPVGV